MSCSAPSLVKLEAVVSSEPITAFITRGGAAMCRSCEDALLRAGEGRMRWWLEGAGIGITQTWDHIPTLPLTGIDSGQVTSLLGFSSPLLSWDMVMTLCSCYTDLCGRACKIHVQVYRDHSVYGGCSQWVTCGSFKPSFRTGEKADDVRP